MKLISSTIGCNARRRHRYLKGRCVLKIASRVGRKESLRTLRKSIHAYRRKKLESIVNVRKVGAGIRLRWKVLHIFLLEERQSSNVRKAALHVFPCLADTSTSESAGRRQPNKAHYQWGLKQRIHYHLSWMLTVNVRVPRTQLSCSRMFLPEATRRWFWRSSRMLSISSARLPCTARNGSSADVKGTSLH